MSDGTELPVLGQGTWYIGDDPTKREAEIAALRAGVAAGMTVIDTAEMYGGGRAEALVGEAIKPIRDDVYLVDKVLPTNASRGGTIEACERSLRTLGTDRIDLYLLHWPGPFPEEDTIDAFHELMERGLIGAWGVSNFDADEFPALPTAPAVNEVVYNPLRRGIEYDLLPEHRAVDAITLAYSPIEQGRLLGDPALVAVAERRGATVAQVLLAWAVRDGDVIAIPKASSIAHVQENARATDLTLDAQDIADIGSAFPAPAEAEPLEIL